MNSRYVFTQESLCSSIGGSAAVPAPVEEARIALNSHARPLRNPSPNLLIRLAMKMSRSRWYSFLRRVFHYQNSSGSNLGPNPFDSKNWMLLEFIALSIQIAVTVYTLITSKAEKPVWPMKLWASGYALGCLFNLILLFWRHHSINPIHADTNSSGVDVEQQQRYREESRSSQYIQRFRTLVELLFAMWFVMGNVWVFNSRFGSYHRAPRLHVLCISLLAWNAVSYSFPFILFVLLCCCVPLLSSLLGYNMNTASLQRGATEEQLAILPSWEHEDASGRAEQGKTAKNHEDLECCICLAKYREKEEIRQLPCSRIFHLDCVDQWLMILSCCPLCKQWIGK